MKRDPREKRIRIKKKFPLLSKKPHEYTDKLLEWGKDENSRVRWSGCSTLACVIQDTGISNTENKENPQENKSETVPELKVTFGAEPPKELGLIHLANAGKSFLYFIISLDLFKECAEEPVIFMFVNISTGNVNSYSKCACNNN